MSESKRSELSQRAADLVATAYRAGWAGGIDHIAGCISTDKITPMGLLKRFVELYAEAPLTFDMIEPGQKLWGDYYKLSGDHMILTDEGWESGESKQSYVDEYGPEAILAEVNAPAVVE